MRSLTGQSKQPGPTRLSSTRIGSSSYSMSTQNQQPRAEPGSVVPSAPLQPSPLANRALGNIRGAEASEHRIYPDLPGVQKGREAKLYRKLLSGQPRTKTSLTPGSFLPSGPREQGHRNGRRSRSCRRTVPTEARSTKHRKSTWRLPVPARHGPLRLRGEAVGEPGRGPGHPLAVHQPGSQARGK